MCKYPPHTPKPHIHIIKKNEFKKGKDSNMISVGYRRVLRLIKFKSLIEVFFFLGLERWLSG